MAKDLTAALDRLTKEAAGTTTRTDKVLNSGREATPIPARVGSAGPKYGDGANGGIASPLTETAYADRTFWTGKTITSTDGLITIAISPIKQMTFKDANNEEVIFDYKEPPA